MPKFPTKESNVVELANSMIAGYTAHGMDFPSITAAAKTALQGSLTGYLDNKKLQEDAESQAQIATVTKVTRLDQLVETMKNDLKLSEVDCTGNPTKLTEIGWGTKADPTPTTAPNQPTELTCSPQGETGASFQWNKPLSGSKPNCYILQRRQAEAASQEFGSWQMVDFYYDVQVTAQSQPRGVQLEYRVIASNAAGQSTPSNTVSVVL